MSENDIPNGQPGIPGEPVSQPTPATPVESSPVQTPAEEKPVRAGYAETHTAQNTPMQDVQPSVSEIIRPLTEADREAKGHVNIFLGNTRESQEYIGLITGHWLGLNFIRNQNKIRKASDGELEKAEQDWAEFVKEKLPGKSTQEAEDYAADLYSYLTEVQDGIRIRTRMMREEGVSNVFDRGGIINGEIAEKRAAADVAQYSLSEAMSRLVSNDSGEVYQWTILLRNSYTVINIERPSRMDLGILVNDIRRTIGGYVRDIGGNSLALSSSAARRVIWKFLVKRIVSSSVTDIGDYEQLAGVILSPDLDVLIMGLLEAYTDKGVHNYLGCLAGCGWGEYQLCSPARMVRVRNQIQTPEEAAIYGNLVNGKLKMTRAETLALSRASKYGIESNRVYNDTKRIYLEIGPSTLDEEFATFDYFISTFNPRHAELRQTITDPQEFQTEVSLLFSSLGATEYLHWVRAFVKLPPSDSSDLAEQRFERNGENDFEFNKGVSKILTDHVEWNKETVSFILNKASYMSRTFVGVRNYTCPHCKKNTADHQDPHGLLDRKLGYTPINVVYNFFIHTQLQWMAISLELENHKQKALS